MVKLEDLLPQLQTGDIFLFRGTREISRVIETVTGSPFSHVAMVLRVPGLPRGKDVFLWQARPPQVQVWSLANQFTAAVEWGQVVCRRLEVQRTREMLESLHEFVQATTGTPFPTDMQMGEEWLEGQFGIDSGSKFLFCAQLVAQSYMHMGLLPISPPANHYSPKDFSIEHDHLQLMGKATLGDEIVVTLQAPLPVSSTSAPSRKA